LTPAAEAISGASVAGPALAYFLRRQGCDVTVVERAPVVRDSGYAVDFRGVAFDVLDEMGVLAEVRGLDTRMRGTVLVEARVLARCLAEAGGDHAAAFSAYEAELRSYVAENQARGRDAALVFGGRAASAST
jgi:2-polyprenyl-6-methoxyphenol hydroxylase-like FAD-dependent oxidoreductase